ncbi:hypothetical protein fh0823_24590 [Francisella halioticida]|nr:hypothetical protein fh0823_23820 [Francisella halioticida]BCD92320.1 hypothetical protein fh0823_24590 [Francisella halioticida]
MVHFDKPTEHFEHTITYIGRYIKKPPIAMSKIKEYDGNTIKFRFLKMIIPFYLGHLGVKKRRQDEIYKRV